MLGSILSSRVRAIRHTRVLDIRCMIEKGLNMDDLMKFCLDNLKVTKQTATSYIDEAAEPYRKKYEQEQNNVTS